MDFQTQLFKAIAAHFDSVLTPEVATSIVQMAFADKSVDPLRFPKREYGGYVFAVERLRDIVPEIDPLHHAHYQETERYRHEFKMRADYERLIALERAGTLVQFTVRSDDGLLVGNIRMYLRESTHTANAAGDGQSLLGTEDTFFVLKEHRKGFMALRFWQYMEDCLLALGVRQFETDSKLGTVRADGKKDVGSLNKFIGYTPVSTKFVKIIGEPTHVL